MTLTCLFICETFQFQHHPDGVLIHGIGMEQVELHLPDNVRPLRHVGPQNAMVVHRQQAALHGAGMAEHAEKN